MKPARCASALCGGKPNDLAAGPTSSQLIFVAARRNGTENSPSRTAIGRVSDDTALVSNHADCELPISVVFRALPSGRDPRQGNGPMRQLRLCIPIVLFFAVVAGSVQADDRTDVVAANKAFDNAVSKRDINSIEALWAHDNNVSIIHPSSKEPLVGWEAVSKSWAEGTLARYSDIQLSLSDPHVRVDGNLATVVGTERFQGKRADNGQTVEFQALTTNVFEKRDGRWLMTHHHASRMPQ